MATVAGQRRLTDGAGERLLVSKLRILNGTSARRPSLALGILTGQCGEPADGIFGPPATVDVEVPIEADLPPAGPLVPQARPQFAARTVYLSEAHLRDIQRIIDAWQQTAPRRLNRSAVLRRAVEHLSATFEAEVAAGPVPPQPMSLSPMARVAWPTPSLESEKS